jgi:hypothetical protein
LLALVDHGDRKRLARRGKAERDLLQAPLGDRDGLPTVGRLVVFDARADDDVLGERRERKRAVVRRARRPFEGPTERPHEDASPRDGTVIRIDDAPLQHTAFVHLDVDARLAPWHERHHVALHLDILWVPDDGADPTRRRGSGAKRAVGACHPGVGKRRAEARSAGLSGGPPRRAQGGRNGRDRPRNDAERARRHER